MRDGEHCCGESGEEGESETHFGLLLMAAMVFALPHRYILRLKFGCADLEVSVKELG